MITIIKGNEKIVCTRSTFKDQYESLGYQIASKFKEGVTRKVAPSYIKEEKIEDKQEKKDNDINEKQLNQNNEEIANKYGLKSKSKLSKKGEE